MRLISGFYYETTFEQRGILTADLIVDLQKGHKGTRFFYNKSGEMIAKCIDDTLRIFRGFSCNLCSPSWRVGKRWMGTWTTYKEALGAFLHDFARACYGAVHTPWETLKETDDLFWDALVIMGSHVKRTYHLAVSSFIGKCYHVLTYSGPSITIKMLP